MITITYLSKWVNQSSGKSGYVDSRDLVPESHREWDGVIVLKVRDLYLLFFIK